MLAPLFGALSVPSAAIAGKVLNAILSAAAAGLIAWHAAKTELLGARVPRWVAGAVVLTAGVAIPAVATQGVLFAEPLFCVLMAITIIITDSTTEERYDWIART